MARGPWLDNSGKRWADLAPLPWAALEQDTGLGPEARIKAGDFAADSTQLGWRVGWEQEVGKSMISYFIVLDRKTFVVAGVPLIICRQS